MMFLMSNMLAWRHLYCGPKQFALYAKEHTEPAAVVIAADQDLAIEYYGKRKVLTPSVSGRQEEISKFIKTAEEYLINNTPLYIITSAFSYDRDHSFRNSLLKKFELVLVGGKISEDYHHPELGFQSYNENLYKVHLKSK